MYQVSPGSSSLQQYYAVFGETYDAIPLQWLYWRTTEYVMVLMPGATITCVSGNPYIYGGYPAAENFLASLTAGQSYTIQNADGRVTIQRNTAFTIDIRA